jgi:hypothetical protein
MAGTRLIIQVSFLIPYVALLAAAVYWGLFDDLLLVPLVRQDGRPVLSRASLPPATLARLPPVRLATIETQTFFWEQIVKQRLPWQSVPPATRLWEVLESPHALHLSLCQDPWSVLDMEPYESFADVWICESPPPQRHDHPRIVVRRRTLIFYPTNLQHREREWALILPAIETSQQKLEKELHLTVWVDPYHTSAVEVVERIEQWRSQQGWSDWPCLTSTITDVRVVKNGRKTKMLNVDQIFQVLANDFDSRKRRSSEHLYLWFYATTNHENTTLAVVDEAVSNLFLTTLANTTTYNEKVSFVSMHHRINDWLGSSCLGMPMMDSSGIDWEADESSNVPNLYTTLWFHAMLPTKYAEIFSNMQATKQKLLETPRTVRLTSHGIAEDWNGISRTLQKANQAAENGHFARVLSHLNEADLRWRNLQRDPAWLEPLDFPWDQYAAIFAPLLLPTMLPAILGLGREYKRYRRLCSAKI